jgi:hypothetical protein
VNFCYVVPVYGIFLVPVCIQIPLIKSKALIYHIASLPLPVSLNLFVDFFKVHSLKTAIWNFSSFSFQEVDRAAPGLRDLGLLPVLHELAAGHL